MNLLKSELKILALLAQGFNNSTISEMSSLKVSSIRTIISLIYRKLELKTEDRYNHRVKASLLYFDYMYQQKKSKLRQK